MSIETDERDRNTVRKEQQVLKMERDMHIIAEGKGGQIDTGLAAEKAREWNKDFDEVGLNEKGETREQFIDRQFEERPLLIGLRKGGEADGVNKKLLQEIREGNKTSMSRAVAAHGLPRMNHIARSEGYRDIFQMASGRPSANAPALNAPNPRNSNGELSPWSPQGWNVTRQAQRFRDDPTGARAEMLKWNAVLGQTKPTK